MGVAGCCGLPKICRLYIFRQVGLIRLPLSATGYQPVTTPELLITTGKEVVLEVGMEQKIASLDEVVVTGSQTKKDAVNNGFAGSSACSFTIEEVTPYAGGRNDPGKLASNYAGVVSNNDSRNDIVVRGNSPAGVLWRIEELPAPGPNIFLPDMCYYNMDSPAQCKLPRRFTGWPCCEASPHFAAVQSPLSPAYQCL